MGSVFSHFSHQSSVSVISSNIRPLSGAERTSEFRLRVRIYHRMVGTGNGANAVPDWE